MSHKWHMKEIRTFFPVFLISRFDIIERNLPGGVVSELLIQNSSSSDTAAYTCQVSNNFGNASAIIKLFVLGKLTHNMSR